MRRSTYAILATALFSVSTVTPKPETYLLLLTGVVVLFGMTWLHRRHARELA